MANGGNVSVANFYVGIDWGNEKHALCVVDRAGRVIKERFVANDLELLDALTRATSSSTAEEVFVAMEDRGNPVADTLLAHRFRVHTINPKQVDRFRDRESVSGAKDDRRDARVLARALFTDGVLFRAVAPLTREQALLKGACASIDELEGERLRLANRLRAILVRYFPALLHLCAGADEPWFWRLVQVVGSPENGQHVDDAALAAIISDHRLRKLTVAAIRDVLNRRHLTPADGVVESSIIRAAELIERLDQLQKLLRNAERVRDDVLKEDRPPEGDGPPDAALLRSVPGIGPKSAAVLLADARELLRAGNHKALRAIAGVCPVTKRSGKTNNVVMRRSVNGRLRECLHHVAATTVRHSPRFGEQYRRLRAAGHGHARALRGVSDSLLGVIAAMFRTRTPFTEKAPC